MAEDVASYVSNMKQNVNPETLSDKKSTIAHSQAASYLSKRLNKGNGQGKSLKLFGSGPHSNRFNNYASE